MTAQPVTVEDRDPVAATRQLVDSFTELPPHCDGRPGTEPQYAALLNGYVKAAAAIWLPAFSPDCETAVHDTFINLVAAVEELREFNQWPSDWLDQHDLPRTDAMADVKYHDLDSDVDHWTQQLAEAVR